MLDWPTYTLANGWLKDERGRICPHQVFPFTDFVTVNDADKWLAANDIRGSVRGSTWKLPSSRDFREK